MEKSPVHEALERAYSNPKSDWLNPDNHDKVHIALGLLNAESSDRLTTSLDNLKSQIMGLQYTVSTALEQQAAKMIASNERLAISNEYYAKWSRTLAAALIAATLIVGLLQAGVLVWQTFRVAPDQQQMPVKG